MTTDPAPEPLPEPLPYATPAQVNADSEHLRLLAIFHYILGGMFMLFSSCALIHVGLGIAMIVDPSLFQTAPGSPPPPAFTGYIFAAMGSAVIVMGWTIGGATIYSGRCIARQRHRLFSCIVAGVNCLSIPFGTILGIFTLIVLCRPSVKGMYEHAGR